MVFKSSLFLMLLLVVGFGRQDSARVESRPAPFLAQQKYSKIFATLGVVCKCCDGVATAGGEDRCITSWAGACSDIRCLPWKFYS